MRTAVLIDGGPYDPHAVLIEYHLFAACLISDTSTALRRIARQITRQIASLFSYTL